MELHMPLSSRAGATRVPLALVLAFSSFIASAVSLTLTAAPASAAPGAIDTARNNQWTSFANGNGDWNGADGTIGVRTADGRIAWAFSDTYKGPIAAGNVRPPFQDTMVRNSAVMQSSASTAASLTSVRVGGTGWDAQTLVNPPAGSFGGSYLWAGDGVATGTTLQRLYLVFAPPSGCEIYGAHYATALATFDVSGATPQLTGNQLVGSTFTSILWGTAVIDVGDFTYIYGTEITRGAGADGCGVTHSYLHVARVPRHNFATAWSYYTDGSWLLTGQGSRGLDGVSSEFSVTATGGKYVLVTQQVGGAGIVSYSSSSPTGFNAGAVSPVLYSAPEFGASRHVYAARLQPALSNSTTAVISYNVNTPRKSTDACADENMFNATIYRPRFITVPVSALISTGGAAATIPAGLRDLRAPDPATKASGAGSGDVQVAAAFPTNRITWGLTCRTTTPTPTGLVADMSDARTSATVTWNWVGPTMFTVVYRKFAWEDEWEQMPFMLVGAWPTPNVPELVVNVGPVPATGTPTQVRLVDDWNGAAQISVQYKACFSRWGGTPEVCSDPVYG
jgi:hypothetical protein